MQRIDRIQVLYENRDVGTLARTKDDLFAFEYHDDWLHSGFSLNPLSLPLEKRVFIPRRDPLDGMFGVFQDSIPDGWGRLLVDRYLSAQGEDLSTIDDLIRLTIVGASGMGALSYRPDNVFETSSSPFSLYQEDLDKLAAESLSVFSHDPSADLDTLFALGGSSGGARPKILTTIDGEDWIIKFPSTIDPPEIGEQEYAYALAAKDCGIDMPQTRLFPSKLCPGYFGAKRFDRATSSQRIHMVSVAGLLETSHRLPNLDYHTIMKLILRLTEDMSELNRLYRQMCFNVFAHNRDDHSKNFSFLYHEQEASWRLSPAYDLPYSSSHYGEHATTVAGNGKDPGLDDLLSVATQAGLSQRWAKATAREIKNRTHELRQYWKSS